MMNWNRLNYELSQQVLAKNLLDELFVALDCDLRDRHDGQVLRGCCPVHRGRDTNFAVRLGGDILPIHWKCYSHHCHEKYKCSLLGLVRGVLSENNATKATLMDAVKFLRKLVGKPVAISNVWQPPAVKTTTPPQPRTREQVRAGLKIPAPLFLERGISGRILDEFDVGYDIRLGRTVVPVYANTGLCVGYVARSRHPACSSCGKHHAAGSSCSYGEPKWLYPTGFEKSSYIYNLARASETDYSSILVVEGPVDVLVAAEAGIPAVAILGNRPSVVQADILNGVNKRMAVCLDNDVAGREGTRIALEMLRGARHLPIPEEYHDVGSMPTEKLRQHILKKKGTPS